MKNYSRFFRFSIKAFLTFVLVCAVGMAWVVKKQDEHQAELAAIAGIQAATKMSTYDYAESNPRAVNTKIVPVFLVVR